MKNTTTDHELDALLTQWAQRHALPSAKAEAIRLAARTTAPAPSHEIGLSVDWWKDLYRGISREICRSTDARRYLPFPSQPL